MVMVVLADSGGVVACGSGAGQGIYVTTNESTIVARSCLLEMRFLLLLLPLLLRGRKRRLTTGKAPPADTRFSVSLLVGTVTGSG